MQEVESQGEHQLKLKRLVPCVLKKLDYLGVVMAISETQTESRKMAETLQDVISLLLQVKISNYLNMFTSADGF